MGGGGSKHCSQELRERGLLSTILSVSHPAMMATPTSQLFIASAHPGNLCRLCTVAMKSMLLPVLARCMGCCPGGALAKQGLSLREPIAPPTPRDLPTLQPRQSTLPGPPDGE